MKSSTREPRKPPVWKADVVTLAHGSGGKAMRELIEGLLLPSFDNEQLSTLEDQARIDISELARLGNQLAFTTDSFVVFPIFFPGGDIGKLAVAGTVNDLAVCGAKPLFLTCSFIIEEGLSTAELARIVQSMKATATECGVAIVTGDTKVVERGAADKIFINTAGIGVIEKNVSIGANRAQPGDKVIINGFIGDHGCAIVSAREDLALEASIDSDCRQLYGLISKMISNCPEIHCMRDATRGGLATVLNEFASQSEVCIKIFEKDIPIRPEVRGVCEILGLDPLYLANEGKLVTVVPSEHAENLVSVMRKTEGGEMSSIIGEVLAEPISTVTMKTAFGGDRIVDMLVGDQLPRIC